MTKKKKTILQKSTQSVLDYDPELDQHDYLAKTPNIDRMPSLDELKHRKKWFCKTIEMYKNKHRYDGFKDTRPELRQSTILAPNDERVCNKNIRIQSKHVIEQVQKVAILLGVTNARAAALLIKVGMRSLDKEFEQKSTATTDFKIPTKKEREQLIAETDAFFAE